METKPELIKGIEPAYSQIVSFDAINKMKAEYLTLKVKGLEDKEGLIKVHDARIAVRDYRIAVEKLRKDLKADSLEYGRQVDAIAKKFTLELEPIEAYLAKEEEVVEAEKTRIKEEKKRAEAEVLNKRIQELAKYGAAADVNHLSALSDELFNNLLTNHRIEWEAAIAKKEAEAKAQKEESEKLALEKKAFEAEQAKAREEQEKVRKENEAKEAEIRKQQEAIESEKREIQRQKELEEAKKIAAEKAKVEERNRIEQEQKDKAERERLAIIEAEEKAAQAPDIEKLSIFYGAIANIHIPQMKSKKYKAIVSDIEVLITGILAKFPK